MRKILFFIILIPFFASLGHDIYAYTLDQRKGFQLSDIGALWSKYHRETHDQWKIKVKEIGDVVTDLAPDMMGATQERPEDKSAVADYSGSFTQISEEHKDSVIKALKQDGVEVQATKVQKCIGTILEQKAVFVAAGFAAVIYILNLILSFIFGGRGGKGVKEEKGSAKSKNGSYKYGRK